MCYSTNNSIGGVNTWTNRIFYDNFNDDSWKRSFVVDTWNNSQFCCSDPTVSPTYNKLDNVLQNNGELVLRVEPFTGERIVAYSSSVSSIRDDILYGSFRMSAKMTPVNGSSFGFFFFYSISEEIDIEVLAHEQDEGRVRVSIQPIIRDNLNRASNLSQKLVQLNKSLSLDFIEYRFDWFKDRVDFYVEGDYYHSLNVNIPSHHGKMVVNHRSNGNQRWSRGPPLQVSDTYIKYFDLYFNSSESSTCTDVNYVNEIVTGEDDVWERYRTIIVVCSFLGLILITGIVVNVWRKFRYPEIKTENKIYSRRP